MMTERQKNAYLMRLASGRGAFARAADDIAIRLIVLAASYLYLKSRVPDAGMTLLLSLCLTWIAGLMLRLYAMIVNKRRIARVRGRIAERLLDEKFLLLPGEVFEPLLQKLAGGGTPVLIQQNRPADADMILAAYRARTGNGPMVVFATGGYTECARALALRMPDKITLVPQEKLRKLACGGSLRVSERELEAYIEAERALEKTRRRKKGELPFLAGMPKKYVLTALALTLISFLPGYALYYRMLAGLCMSIAAAGALIGRGRNAERG